MKLNQTSGSRDNIPALKIAHIRISIRCLQVRSARNLLHVNYAFHGEHDVIYQTPEIVLHHDPWWGGGGGGTPLIDLNGYVPLNRVWFSGSCVLNRVYNFTIYSVLNRLSFCTRSLEQVVNVGGMRSATFF